MRARRPWSAAGLAAVPALSAYALWWEPRRIRVRRVELELERWPAALDGLRVVAIADLHAGAPHASPATVERVVAYARRARPDLVALLGDYVDPEVAGAQPVSPEAVAGRLGALAPPLGVVAVLGNHDWRNDGRRVAAALRAAGVVVLENGSVAVGRGLHVAGVADEMERRADPVAALARVPEDAPVILLAHNPDTFPRVPARVALTLSGHTHGGQVNLPVLRRRAIPSRYGDRYAAGHVVEGGRHLFVSRGIGTSRLPLRLGAPPELLLLVLRAGAPQGASSSAASSGS